MQPLIIERIAEWVSGLRFGDLPARVVELARAQRLSVWGGAAAGMLLPEGKRMLAVAGNNGGGWSTFVPTGERLSARDAILAHAALATAFDYDEVVLVGHTGHTAVSVPWAIAEDDGADPARDRAAFERVVVAQVASVEVMARLGLATFFGPQNGQMLPFAHQVGAAVAAAKIWGLDATRVADAIGLALASPPAPLWPAFLAPTDCKLLVAALPALTGLDCARLARGGVTAPHDSLDHPHGFFRRFTTLAVRNAFSGFGRAWLLETLSVKPYPACWYFQTAIEAARDIVARAGSVAPDSVRSVVIDTNLLACAVDAHSAIAGGDTPTANLLNFSLALTTALVLSSGTLRPEDLTPDALAARSDELRAWRSKVTVRHALSHSLDVVRGVDDLLDLPGLIAASPIAIARAWRATATYFPRLPGFTGRRGDLLREAVPVLRGVGEAVHRLSRREPYDLGAHDLAAGALAMGTTVTVTPREGAPFSATRVVHDGALGGTRTPLEVATEKFIREVGRARGEAAARALLPEPGRIE